MDAVEKTGHGTLEKKLLSETERFEEILLNGMRIHHGIRNASLIKHTGAHFEEVNLRVTEKICSGIPKSGLLVQKLNMQKVVELEQQGFLIYDAKGLRPTRRGMAFVDALLLQLLR